MIGREVLIGIRALARAWWIPCLKLGEEVEVSEWRVMTSTTTWLKPKGCFNNLCGFGGDGYSEVKHVDARAIPRWVTYWEAAPELPETKPGFGVDGYSEVKHVDVRAISEWVTYWEAAPELPETKPDFGGDEYSEVKHVDARAIPGWVTYWEAAPELPETKP
ncbi:hypothetical protein ACLB2K_026212 [Fragaria x ananassa]